MAAIGMVVERLPAGLSTRRQRSTASRCCIVMQGFGRSSVGDKTFDWRRGDTIAVPTWTAYEHRADEDAQLFWMSDEPLMRMCNYWRHETV
jgi:gentisate 1,2-dioxygenase